MVLVRKKNKYITLLHIYKANKNNNYFNDFKFYKMSVIIYVSKVNDGN
jgi:hypothetical protein